MIQPIKISLVVAACEGNGIGKNGSLPWRLKKEMEYFTKITTEAKPNKRNAIIMGKKTWLSIPAKVRPLPNRLNVVVSSTMEPSSDDKHIVSRSFSEAIEACKEDVDQVFVIGGYGLYKECLASEYLDKVYMTRILKHYDCDTFFPDFDLKDFEKIQLPNIPSEVQEENGINYTYCVYKKH